MDKVINDEVAQINDEVAQINDEVAQVAQVAHLFEQSNNFNYYRVLKGTSFMYDCYHREGLSEWVGLDKDYSGRFYKNVTFEYVLDNSPSCVQEELLFHLDIFLRETK
jgi:hypothetical protein